MESVDSAIEAATNADTNATDAVQDEGGAEPKTNKKESEETAVQATNDAGSLRLVTCTQCSLIDPLEVHVEELPVHIAEPVLTPIESLRRKDEVIKQTLIEKQNLVSRILNVPKRNEELDDTELTSDLQHDRKAAELIRASIEQCKL